MIRTCGLSRKVFLWGVLCAFALVSLNCGGGGGGGTSYSYYTGSNTSTSDTLDLDTGATAEKTVGMMLRLPDALSMSGAPAPGITARTAGRASRAAARTAASTQYYNNEYDPDSGCTMNGSMTVTPTSSSTADISMDMTLTSCDDSEQDGDYESSGTMTVYSSSSAYFSTTMTVTPEGGALSFTIPVKGTYDANTDTFEPSGTMYIAVNGTDEYGTTYTNFKFKESDNGFTVTGKVKDTDGLELTFMGGTELREDGSFDIVARTNNDIKAVIEMDDTGAGSATFTQYSTGATLLSATWNASGAGTITFADGSSETFDAES